jgi:hypothetical protein
MISTGIGLLKKQNNNFHSDIPWTIFMLDFLSLIFTELHSFNLIQMFISLTLIFEMFNLLIFYQANLLRLLKDWHYPADATWVRNENARMGFVFLF